ncbi:hypothetical protein HYALB_00002178 [Hymenoscyphus albidus]|uniref:Ribosome biogenesis protein SLX9 n=1 Tax=Hymenoscyphus albidus TaxID=595503 RepID=A0A9N9LP14_9HELO|nr:hypothetical protein HYALB_00002178 [Hymenoscyphus albidus]
MAPTAPKKRPSIRSKTASKPRSGSGLISRPEPKEPTTSSSFPSTKKDKRLIKSSTFLNRISKSSTKKPLKRRRPSKKLVTTLESLGDALPDLVESSKKGDAELGKVAMKSLTSGKGSMKRRGKVEKVERERFGRNLATFMREQDGVSKAVTGEGGGVERFRALREWIGKTMEKEGAFGGKE